MIPSPATPPGAACLVFAVFADACRSIGRGSSESGTCDFPTISASLILRTVSNAPYTTTSRADGYTKCDPSPTDRRKG